MKRTKFLMPILSGSAIAAAIAPAAIMTACSKNAFTVTKIENKDDQEFHFQLKWKNYNPKSQKHKKYCIDQASIKYSYAINHDSGVIFTDYHFNDNKIVSGKFQLYRPVAKDDSVEVWFSFNIVDGQSNKIIVKGQKIYITCVAKSK